MAAVELPPIVGGRYRPIRLLGRGGMGVVYEVEHVHTGQRLALKVLASFFADSPQVVERFQREARAPAQIKSEHVVSVTDADVAPELGNAPYVVMELLEGEDLSARVGSAPEPPERVVGWLRQIARALDKAHRLGIVHRDLKPANLFVTLRPDGSELVKILDFGIAKMADARSRATSTGEMLGTPAYMSPEQARGDADVTGAADRFALGLIAYRFLCGAIYWRTTGIAQLVHEILYAPLAPPSTRESTLGPAFDEWFARATSREPSGRFESAAEQVEALARALGLSTLPAGDPVTPVHEPRAISPVSGSRALPSVALAPTEQTSPPRSRTDGRGRERTVALIVAGVLACGAAIFAIVPRSSVGPAPPPANASAQVPALAAPPAPSPPPLPTVTAPASSADAPDAALPPHPRASHPGASRPLGPQRPLTTADPFGDQK